MNHPASMTLPSKRRDIFRVTIWMCRFSGIGDPEYQKVAAAIERILQNLPTKLQLSLVRLNETEPSKSVGSRTPDISPQWSYTGNSKMGSSGPVPKTHNNGQA